MYHHTNDAYKIDTHTYTYPVLLLHRSSSSLSCKIQYKIPGTVLTVTYLLDNLFILELKMVKLKKKIQISLEISRWLSTFAHACKSSISNRARR